MLLYCNSLQILSTESPVKSTIYDENILPKVEDAGTIKNHEITYLIFNTII